MSSAPMKRQVVNSSEDLCLTAGKDYNIALDYSACPTTVAGTEWVNSFVRSLPEVPRKLMYTESSSRVYNFGGGERRSLMGVVFRGLLYHQGGSNQIRWTASCLKVRGTFTKGHLGCTDYLQLTLLFTCCSAQVLLGCNKARTSHRRMNCWRS